jgi:hypothetical protein
MNDKLFVAEACDIALRQTQIAYLSDQAHRPARRPSFVYVFNVNFMSDIGVRFSCVHMGARLENAIKNSHQRRTLCRTSETDTMLHIPDGHNVASSVRGRLHGEFCMAFSCPTNRLSQRLAHQCRVPLRQTVCRT